MLVFIRADASPALGIGHIKRTLALANALRLFGVKVQFITREMGVDTAALLRGHACSVMPVTTIDSATQAAGNTASEHDDAAATIAAVGDDEPEWIIVDHYYLGTDWHRAVRAATGARIVAIDDLANRALTVDLIVDHNWHNNHALKYDGVANGTLILGGPRYALIDQIYREAPRYEFQERVRSIGVFMGGVDLFGATTVVLDAVATLNIPIEVATTSANPNLAELHGYPGVTVTVDRPNLSDFFARHDLQVGAGGGASWERCCIGAPSVLLAVAGNQIASVPGLVSLGAAATARLDPTEIRSRVRQLIDDPPRRRAMSERARALVDGRGADRVALRLCRDELTVRLATFDDAAIAFEWRNHPATRDVSRTTHPIGWNEHLAWFGRVLADTGRTLFVAEVGSMPVGIIRFDRIDARAVEVSLYLDPALHGLGLGQRMLQAGATTVRGFDIHATVMDRNAASAGMFARAGFSSSGPNHWIKTARSDRSKGS